MFVCHRQDCLQCVLILSKCPHTFELTASLVLTESCNSHTKMPRHWVHSKNQLVRKRSFILPNLLGLIHILIAWLLWQKKNLCKQRQKQCFLSTERTQTCNVAEKAPRHRQRQDCARIINHPQNTLFYVNMPHVNSGRSRKILSAHTKKTSNKNKCAYL